MSLTWTASLVCLVQGAKRLQADEQGEWQVAKAKSLNAPVLHRSRGRCQSDWADGETAALITAAPRHAKLSPLSEIYDVPLPLLMICFSPVKLFNHLSFVAVFVKTWVEKRKKKRTGTILLPMHWEYVRLPRQVVFHIDGKNEKKKRMKDKPG